MWNLVALSFVASLVLYYVKHRFAGGKCRCSTQLEGKVVIITGASSGIGKATALELGKRGAHVVLACRNLSEAEKVREWIVKCTGNKFITCIQLDLNSFASIRKFVEEFKQGHQKLYALVNNAGVFYFPKTSTEDGFDVTFQTNYLGSNILVDTIDPGNVETRIYRNFPFLSNPVLFALQKPIRLFVIKTPWEGAQSVLHSVLRPAENGTSGKYFCDCQETLPSDLALRKDFMDELWKKSLKWCQMQEF